MRPSARRRRRSRTVALTVLLGGCCYLAAIAVAGLSARPRAAALAVVFGNALAADGGPSPRLRARLDRALLLYRTGTVRRILVSGGVEEPGARDEAAAMAAYLEQRGVPAQAVAQDAAGVDTAQTARHTAGLMTADEGGVVVVTQWFHIPRAVLAMHRFGLPDVSGDWPRWFEARDIYSLLREAVALPFYALRYRSSGTVAGTGATGPAGSPPPRS